MAPKGRVGMGGRSRSLKRMESPEFHLMAQVLGPTASLPVTLVSFYSAASFGVSMALGFSLALCGASCHSLSSWHGQPSPRMGLGGCSSLPVWSCWDLPQSGPLTHSG
uniref:Uncharacterized protein n=1 Tax=Oryctolagus cuniculus TaxID=9986 RepID=A0A5F9C589_RABIT